MVSCSTEVASAGCSTLQIKRTLAVAGPGKAGPEMTAKDFGLPDEIDLDGVDPEDL